MKQFKKVPFNSNLNVKNIVLRTFINHYSKKLVYSFDNLVTYRES